MGHDRRPLLLAFADSNDEPVGRCKSDVQNNRVRVPRKRSPLLQQNVKESEATLELLLVVSTHSGDPGEAKLKHKLGINKQCASQHKNGGRVYQRYWCYQWGRRVPCQRVAASGRSLSRCLTGYLAQPAFLPSHMQICSLHPR